MPTLHDPIAITLGPLEIRWYALFIVIGISLAVWLAMWLANQRGMNGELILDMAPLVVLGAIVGARLYYVILEWDRYKSDLGGAINIRSGGLTIHGAIIAGGLIVWLYTRKQKEGPWPWLDVIVPAVALGQAIGRWGNWANQEAFGTPTSLPWAVTIDPSRRPAGYEEFSTFHPTFLYESIYNAIICTVLVLLVLHQQRFHWFRAGMAVGFYFLGYGVVRFFLERIRTDSLYIGPLPAAYWLSFALIIAGIAILMIRWPRSAAINQSA